MKRGWTWEDKGNFFGSFQDMDRGIRKQERGNLNLGTFIPASFSAKKEQRYLTEAENLVVVLLYSDMFQQKIPRTKLKRYNSGSWGRKLKSYLVILTKYFFSTLDHQATLHFWDY